MKFLSLSSLLMATAMPWMAVCTDSVSPPANHGADVAAKDESSSSIASGEEQKRFSQSLLVAFKGYRGMTLDTGCGRTLVTSYLVAANSASQDLEPQNKWFVENFQITEEEFTPVEPIVYVVDMAKEQDNKKNALDDNKEDGGEIVKFDPFYNVFYMVLVALSNGRCRLCWPDPDRRHNVVLDIFRNANDYLKEGTVKEATEAEMLSILQQSDCPSFSELEEVSVEVVRNTVNDFSRLMQPQQDATTVVDGEKAVSSLPKKELMQQVVITKMDGVQPVKFHEASCKEAYNEAWLQAISEVYNKEEYNNNHGAVVQTVTIDSTDFMTSTMGAVNKEAEDSPTTSFLRQSSSSSSKKKGINTLSHGIFQGHMDILHPQYDAQYMRSNFYVFNNQEAKAMAVRHYQFESTLETRLKNNKKCDAFQSISNVQVDYQGLFDPEKKPLEKKNVANEKEAVVGDASFKLGLIIELVHVDGDPEGYCFSCLGVSVKSAFNKIISPMDQTPEVGKFLLKSIDYKAQPGRGRALQESPSEKEGHVDMLGDSLLPTFKLVTIVAELEGDEAFFAAAPSLSSPEHRAFEEKVMSYLVVAELCEAFQTLENVIITYSLNNGEVVTVGDEVESNKQ